MKRLLGILLFFTNTAFAAQVGQVIVDAAPVYEYPQFASKLISKLKKGDSVPVSNLPTEGFYKVRLKNGDLGWISGNDVFVGVQSGKSPPPKVKFSESTYPTDEEAEDAPSEPAPVSNAKKNTRVLLGLGLQNLNYTGPDTKFQGIASLNYGTNAGLEVQFRWTDNLFWAFRVETLFTSAPALTVANGSSQTMSQNNIPIQLGLVYSVINAKKFRLGVGAYLGLSISKLIVDQTPVSGTEEANTYSTTSPTGTLALQGFYALSKSFELFAEADYRYEKTSQFPQSNLGSTSFAPFTIDYSGVMGRVGIELKF